MKTETIYVCATIRLQIEKDVKVDINDVLADMDYNFKSQTKGAEIADTEWLESNVQGEDD